MPEPSAHSVGFALAATIARDPGAKLAHIGIASDVRDAWCGLARDLEHSSKAERRDRIRKLTAGLRQAQTLPARVQTARPGFTPEPELARLLRRIAQRTAAP